MEEVGYPAPVSTFFTWSWELSPGQLNLWRRPSCKSLILGSDLMKFCEFSKHTPGISQLEFQIRETKDRSSIWEKIRPFLILFLPKIRPSSEQCFWKPLKAFWKWRNLWPFLDYSEKWSVCRLILLKTDQVLTTVFQWFWKHLENIVEITGTMSNFSLIFDYTLI